MRQLVTIGLDEPLAARLREALDAHVVSYPAVPALHALDGHLYVESARVAGRWLLPKGVVYYSYFDDARDARRALALAAVPTFPDVRATLPLDDKVLALVAALRADPSPPVARGYLPPGPVVVFHRDHVLKWGDRHCGEGKARVFGEFTATEGGVVVEPFLEGTSERVLLVGSHAWQLRYESDDWRKNVRARVTEVPRDERLVERARATASALGLSVAGLDYVVTAEGAALLEVNAYPGLEDLPAAQDAFVELAQRWWTSLSP